MVLDRVSVYNGELLVLQDVTLRLPLGPRIAVIGPSGAGKTTLLEAIVGWRPLSDGTASLRLTDGDRSCSVQRDVSYVPVVSNAVVFPTESWRFKLLLERLGSASDDEIRHVLKEVHFPDIELGAPADRNLLQGETQRFLLARAFLSNRPVALFDELCPRIYTKSFGGKLGASSALFCTFVTMRRLLLMLSWRCL